MFLFIAALWLLFSFIPPAIAEKKGNGRTLPFLVSIFLSPVVGLLVAMAEPANKARLELQSVQRGEMKHCPYCIQLVHPAASICPHCRQSLLAKTPPASTAFFTEPPAEKNRKWRVSHEGKEIGEMSKSLIQRKVRFGELDVVDDLYFDPTTCEWVPLGVLVDR